MELPHLVRYLIYILLSSSNRVSLIGMTVNAMIVLRAIQWDFRVITAFLRTSIEYFWYSSYRLQYNTIVGVWLDVYRAE